MQNTAPGAKGATRTLRRFTVALLTGAALRAPTLTAASSPPEVDATVPPVDRPETCGLAPP